MTRLRSIPARLTVMALVTGLAACAPDPGAIWQNYQESLLRGGFLRTERDPREITYNNADIARSFRRIMFFDEFALENDSYRPGLTMRALEKRSGPVAYALSGKGVTARDRGHLAEIAARIAKLTGLDIHPARDANTPTAAHIFIANRKERQDFADILAERGAASPLVAELRNDLNGNVCIAVPFQPRSGRGAAHYLIFIPDELQGVLRRACIEEEFAQAFGPAADFAGARPSIFNDNQEFALFTEFDSWMFRVLYDQRLKAGMLESEAMPIVHRILAEIRPGR